MKLVKLRRKVPAQATKHKENGAQETVRKIPHLIKGMTMFSQNEEVNYESRAEFLHEGGYSKQVNRTSGFIRIQLEEIKRKVRSSSPAELSFIGPGDHRVNKIKKGVITSNIQHN